MKNILLIILALTLSACGMFGPQRPGPIKVVTVDKGIPVCPSPPQIQKTEYMVDKLVPEDEKVPGKVAKAYVYDVTLLRSQIKIYQRILDEYNKTHQDFGAVQTEIDKLQPTK